MSARIRMISLEELNAGIPNTMMEVLGIRFTRIGEDFVQGEMPVDARTHQVYGILHGGASVALAESLGSMASMLVADSKHYKCVGLEINANHLRSVSSGKVIGVARPIHLGRTTHIWDIRITDDRDRLICISRLTVAVISK